MLEVKRWLWLVIDGKRERIVERFIEFWEEFTNSWKWKKLEKNLDWIIDTQMRAASLVRGPANNAYR